MLVRLFLCLLVLLNFSFVTEAQLSKDKWAKGLIGTWFGKGIVMGDSVVYSAKVESVLANEFICIHLRDTAQRLAYIADIYIGYDSVNSSYVCHWLDDSGAKNSTILGTGKKHGDKVDFQFDYPGSPMQTSIAVTEQGWTFQSIFVTARGVAQTFGEVHFVRQ